MCSKFHCTICIIPKDHNSKYNLVFLPGYSVLTITMVRHCSIASALSMLQFLWFQFERYKLLIYLRVNYTQTYCNSDSL